MPIKSLEHYLFERGLTSTLPLETLKDARLGIDVNHYLSRVVNNPKEPFTDAVGGFPSTLRYYIEADIEIFKKHNITPVFVFSGHDIVDTYTAKSSKDISHSERLRNRSWQAYQAHATQAQSVPVPAGTLPIPPMDPFKDIQTPFSHQGIVSDLIDIFVKKEVSYIRAPYFSWVQLGYMYRERTIDAIYGPTETILLDAVDKFILGVEFMEDVIRFVDKTRVLTELNISSAQLLEIAVSVGCDLQLTTLPIYTGVPPNALFDVGLEIFQTGHQVLHHVASLNNEDVLTRFKKGFIALKHIPVLKSDGLVDDLEGVPPSDLHDIVGQRLPHEFYFYESIGLIQPKVLESVTFDTYVEKAPLDGGASTQYRNLVKAMVPIKNKEMSLLTQSMNRFYQFKKLRYVKYFETADTNLETRTPTPVYFGVNNILAYSDKPEFSMPGFIESIATDSATGFIAEPVFKSGKLLIRDNEIISTSLIRTLHILDLYSPKATTKWAEAIKVISTLDSRFQSQYIIFLALLKLSPFGLHETFANIHGTSRATEQSAREVIQLISRLLCFIPVSQNARSHYVGPVSRALLAFRSCVDLVNVNVRELFESVLVSSLSNSEVEKMERTNKQWRQLVAQMPYGNTTPNTILAVIGQTLLDHANATNNYVESNRVVIDHFAPLQYGLTDVSGDLKKGFTFVKECIKIAECLNKNELITEKNFSAYKQAEVVVDKVLNTLSK